MTSRQCHVARAMAQHAFLLSPEVAASEEFSVRTMWSMGEETLGVGAVTVGKVHFV